MPFPWDGDSFPSSILIVISIVLMGVSTFKPQVFSSVRTSVADGFSPVLILMSLPFQHASIFWHDVSGLAQLQADNSRLKQENIRLRDWYQMALLLDSENKSLRELLNLKVDPQYDHVSARVIADAGNTYVKSLLVPVGLRDGVVNGAAVLSGDGLIGRIVEAGEETSRILLVTDINSRVPIVVEGTGQHAIMAGENTLDPILIHLPQDSEIRQGARLITSGYGGMYPHGLPVGKVVVDNKNVMGVTLFSNFDRIQIVKILKKENRSTHNKNN